MSVMQRSQVATPQAVLRVGASRAAARSHPHAAHRLWSGRRLLQAARGVETTEPQTVRIVIEGPPKPVPMADKWKIADLTKELTQPEKFGQRGEGWFIAQIAALLCCIAPPPQLEGLISALGVALIGGGLGLVFLGQRDLGDNLSPLPTPRERGTLITTGIYEYVRHPMYAGLLMAAFGWACFTDDASRFACVAGLTWVLDQKASFEENALESRFGDAYRRYKESGVKKLLPFLY